MIIIKVYQLVLKGNHALFRDKAVFEDKVLFKSKEEITDEYVQGIKRELLDKERNPLKYWKVDIKEFIKTYDLCD